MTPAASFLLAFLYLVVAAAVANNEYHTIVKRGGDSFTIVLAFVFIYLLLPGIGIYCLLGIYGADLRTGNAFFDKVFERLDFVDSLTVCLLTALFILGLYLSARIRWVGYSLVSAPKKELLLRDVIVFFGVSALAFICGKFFMGLGENFLERYINLILFRNLDASVERTFFSANAFSLTQTLTWLAASIFFIYLVEKKYVTALGYFLLMLFAAFLMGSRRGFIFPLSIIYFGSVLLHADLHFRKLFLIVPVVFLWVGFGKELTGSVAYDLNTVAVLDGYKSAGSMMLRALSDIGISQIESLAVLQYFDIFPRFGLDHLLSVLRRIPDGMIGLDIDWPERIVRITTKAFASENDADIPPGLIGQSWLDFPVAGALLWGLIIGVQCRLLNCWMSRFAHTPAKVIFVVLLALVIALPINTGSYDFTFSVDIIFLVLLIAVFFRGGVTIRSSKSAGLAGD